MKIRIMIVMRKMTIVADDDNYDNDFFYFNVTI